MVVVGVVVVVVVGATGRMPALGSDHGESPKAFTAATRKRYSVPFMRLVAVRLVRVETEVR